MTKKANAVNWIYFPKSQEAPDLVRSVVRVFEGASPQLLKRLPDVSSNEVLEIVRSGGSSLMPSPPGPRWPAVLLLARSPDGYGVYQIGEV
jgi:hypothetical protein